MENNFLNTYLAHQNNSQITKGLISAKVVVANKNALEKDLPGLAPVEEWLQNR